VFFVNFDFFVTFVVETGHGRWYKRYGAAGCLSGRKGIVRGL
jgi:hypothetical protein